MTEGTHVSYRGRLTEAARERIRTGGVEISATAWMLDAEQVDDLVIHDVTVNINDPDAYLMLDCRAPDTEAENGAVHFTVSLDQAEAMQIMFAAQLDETPLPRFTGRAPVDPPNVDPPLVTGGGAPIRGVQITVDSVFPREHSER